MTFNSSTWLSGALCVIALAWAGWRWWSARALVAQAASAPTSTPPPWHEVLGPLGPLLDQVGSRTDAVRSLAQLLQRELGAQDLKVLQVRRLAPERATLQAWPEDPLLHAPAAFDAPLSQVPLGTAIRQGGVSRAEDGTGFAMAWPGVVLVCGATGPDWDGAQVEQLLGVAHAMVSRATSNDEGKTLPKLGQTLVESLPASLFVFEPDELRLTDINQEAQREFSLDRSQVIGRTLVEAFGLAASQVAEPRMRQALAQEGVVECDYAWTNRLGPRVLQVRHRALRDAQGKVQLLLVVARDVTQERQAQAELQETQNRFMEFSEAMEDSLFIANPERTQFNFLAGSTCELWGVTLEDVARGDVFANILKEDLPLLEDRMQCERSLQPANFVFRVQHPRKGLIALRTRSRTIEAPNGSLRVYGVVSDVTQEQAREGELLAARDAAETASLAKSYFMANMSHEIRTPMNGILGMTELLLNTSLTPQQREFAQAVYHSGESLLTMLDDILDYAKLDAGSLDLNNSDFALRAVVEDTLELVAPRAHQKGLELNLREGAGTPAWVHGDAQRLRQILSKFVANAVKFTDSGEVVVDVQPVPSEGPGWWLEFSVTDTGPGLEEDALARLFTAFTQAEGGLSRHHEGLGLGLAIAGRLVALMGGRVTVSSQRGKGSVFKFTLPLAVAPAQAPSSLAEADASPSLRVLLAEDHVTSRQVLQHLLLDAGMQVTGVENGQQALAVLRESSSSRPFDVALVDIHMPQLDGLDMARALRQDPRHQGVKLILISAGASSEEVRQAQQIGFHGFLSKPVRQAELIQLIASVCRGTERPAFTTPSLSGRVLVVEDNVVNQEVIGQMLRALQLEVHIAAGGLQGLRALCEKSFDLVLMDIMMPGMDGIEALRWFRGGGGERFSFVTRPGTPVVAVTANALDGDEARFLALGFNGYLSKPLRQTQLVHMLSKHLVMGEKEIPRHAATSPAAPLEPAGILALDEDALNRLKELDPRGENQLIQRVIGAFQTSVARLVPQLEEARRNGDLLGVQHVAHTFKSSSASIGAIELSQRCTELETLIRQDRVDNLDNRVDELCKEIGLVSQALGNLLDRQT